MDRFDPLNDARHGHSNGRRLRDKRPPAHRNNVAVVAVAAVETAEAAGAAGESPPPSG